MALGLSPPRPESSQNGLQPPDPLSLLTLVKGVVSPGRPAHHLCHRTEKALFFIANLWAGGIVFATMAVAHADADVCAIVWGRNKSCSVPVRVDRIVSSCDRARRSASVLKWRGVASSGKVIGEAAFSFEKVVV